MSKKRRRKKPTIDYKNLGIQAIVDLVIGIILLILDKLLS